MAAGIFKNDVRSGFMWDTDLGAGRELFLVDTKTGESLTEDEMIELGVF